MDTINRAGAKQIAAAAEKALKQVAADLGLQVRVSGGRFDEAVGTFSPRVEFAVEDSAQREWAQWAPLYDLKVEDFGRSFTTASGTYTVAGVNPKATRFPIIGERGDGKRFKFAAADVARMLAKQ